jgi:hypothetical protein
MLTGITNRDAVAGPSTQTLGKYHGLEDVHSKHNRKLGVAHIFHLTPNSRRIPEFSYWIWK